MFIKTKQGYKIDPKVTWQPKFDADLTDADDFDIGHPLYNNCVSDKCKSANSFWLPTCTCNKDQTLKTIAVWQNHIDTHDTKDVTCMGNTITYLVEGGEIAYPLGEYIDSVKHFKGFL